ncbi:MAG: hypothetical protein KC609_04525 [Myxococcales bacterium]|nr:hypothetical protein [Myxococcales bacterium]
MSDPTHHERHDAAQTPEAERRKQPHDGNATARLDHLQPRAAAPMSFAERVVAQFRAQDPAAWFHATPLERFQAKGAAHQVQRRLVIQRLRNAADPLQYLNQGSTPRKDANTPQHPGGAPSVREGCTPTWARSWT